MPRVRSDNDARYALRASFVDGHGDVIEGDTIVIETPGPGSVFGSYKWSDKEDRTDDKKVSTDSQADPTQLTTLYIGRKTQGDFIADTLLDVYIDEGSIIYIQKKKDASTYVSMTSTGTTHTAEFDKYREYAVTYLSHSGSLSKDDDVVVDIINGTGGAGDPRISDTDITNWNTAYGWGDHSTAGYLTSIADNSIGATQLNVSGNGTTSQFLRSDGDGSFTWATVASSPVLSGVGGGQYGSVYIDGGATGGYEGYSIGGRAVFMHNNSTLTGIYNDVNNQWILQGVHNGATKIYHAGVTKGYTYASGWRVTGNLLATSDIYAYYSDKRLKDVVGAIEKPLESIGAIETFYYTHNDKARELGYEGSERQVGVSAQSVQAVLPEVVGRAPIDDDGEGGSVTGEDYITVKYERIVPLLIEGIKELTAELETVKQELEELKSDSL